MNRERVTRKARAQLLAPAAAITDTAGTRYVDLQGFDAAEVLITHGDVTAAAGANRFDITLQHADAAPGTAGSYETVPASQLRGAFTPLENAVTAGVQAVGYVGERRYLRAVLTETGTASVIASVVAILELSDREPANAKTVTTGAVT